MNQIKSIKITKSEFFKDDLEINFSNKLNCIMGSRGTGKSTLLYFIKSIIDEDSEDNSKIYSILKNNLGNGLIEMIYEDENGNEYKIHKSLNDEPQVYNKSTNALISLAKIRSRINCDIYEALRIEEIGLSNYDRLNLIDKMISNKEEYYEEIKSIQNELKQNAIDVQSESKRLDLLKENIINYENCEEEFEIFEKNPPKEFSKVENDLFKKESDNVKMRRNEKKYIDNIIDDMNELSENVSQKIDYYKEKIDELKSSTGFYNLDIMDTISKSTINLYVKLKENHEHFDKDIKEYLKELKSKDKVLQSLHENQQNKYIVLKQKYDKNKEYLDKHEKLSKKVQEKNDKLKEIEKLIKKLEHLKSIRNKSICKLEENAKLLFKERYNRVKELNGFLKKEVIVTITPGGITDEYNEKLRYALKGSGMKYSIIGPKIISNFKPSELAKVINEKDIDKLKVITGIDKERSQNLIDALYQTDGIYEIESLYCPDLPTIKLRLEEKSSITQDEYRETESLSTGQRCTAVLPIIFAVSNNPLIIDQPEDNLDNKYITQTIQDIIESEKEKRQLIFITHNANIPVLSKSEHNIFLTYEDKQSSIKDGGRGTVEDVKENIIKVLEGGKKAFELRRVKYGF